MAPQDDVYQRTLWIEQKKFVAAIGQIDSGVDVMWRDAAIGYDIVAARQQHGFARRQPEIACDHMFGAVEVTQRPAGQVDRLFTRVD